MTHPKRKKVTVKAWGFYSKLRKRVELVRITKRNKKPTGKYLMHVFIPLTLTYETPITIKRKKV